MMFALYLIAGLLLGSGTVVEIFASWITVFSRKPLDPAALAVAFAAGLTQIIVGTWLAGLLP